MAAPMNAAPLRRKSQIELNLGSRVGLQLAVAGLIGLLMAVGVFLSGRLPYVLVLGYFGVILGGLIGLVIGDIRRWLIGFTFLDASIMLDAYPGFIPEAARLGSISGYVISITSLILPVLYGMWAVELLVTKQKPYRRPLLRAMGPLAIYFVGIALSNINAMSHEMLYFEAFMLTQCLLLMIYMAGSLRTREDVLFIMPFIALSLVIQCLVMTLQRIGYVNPAIVHFASNTAFRPGGVFGSSNVAGSFLGIALLPLMSLFFVKPSPRFVKFALVPLFAWALICLVWTQSRGAWVGFAIGFSLFLVVGWWRRWIRSPVFFSVITIAAVILAIASPVIVARLTTDDQGAAASRGPLNEIAVAIFQDQPLTGIGANNFALELPNYIPPRFGSEWHYTVHNKYLLVLSETGIIGFVGWFGFLLLTLWRGIRLWRLRDPLLSMIGLGILTTLLGHSSHMLNEVFNMRTPVQFLWCYSAMLYAMVRILEEEQRTQPDLPPYLQERTWRPFWRRR